MAENSAEAAKAVQEGSLWSLCFQESSTQMTAYFPRVSNHLAQSRRNCLKCIYTYICTYICVCIYIHIHIREQENRLLLVESAQGLPRLALMLRGYHKATYIKTSIFPKTCHLHLSIKYFKLLSFNSFTGCAGWSSDMAISTCERTGFLVLRNFLNCL